MHHGSYLIAPTVSRHGPAKLDVFDGIATLLACLWAAEVILGGPGYWSFGDNVTIRKVLFAFNIFWFSALFVLGRIRLRHTALALATAVLLFIAVWGALIPLWGNRPLGLALQDGAPAAVVLLGILYHEFFATRRAQWERLCRVIVYCLVAIALFNVALWFLGMINDAGNVAAQRIALYYFTLGRIESAPPLYIGILPDGFFRAMWITGTLYVPALLYCVASRRAGGVILFSVALFVTYTRGLWIAAVFGVLVAQLLSARSEPFMNLLQIRLRNVFKAMLAGLAIGAAFIVSEHASFEVVGSRLTSAFSDNAAGERLGQVFPLIEAWMHAPFFGHGFGASASVIRSSETPYTYELTLLALLMKTGLIGFFAIAIFVCLDCLRYLSLTRRISRQAYAGIAGILAYLLAGTTNPYVGNMVGMSVMSFMLIKLSLENNWSLRGENSPA